MTIFKFDTCEKLSLVIYSFIGYLLQTMPKKKSEKDLTLAEKTNAAGKLKSLNLFDNATKILSLTFYVIWIVIGLFILMVIYSGVKQGAYSNLLSPKQEDVQPEVTNQSPTEVDIEGVGKVNVECTQKSLPNESIQKLVESKDINSLSTEDRQKFEQCLVKESPNPSDS